VRLHEVENPLLEVVKHADLHSMEEVGLREVTHDTRNMSKNIESLVNMEPREFSIGCRGVGIAECSIQVVIPPEVLLVRRDIISKFVLWTFTPKTDMPLEMKSVAILRAICKPCCENPFATHEVATCSANIEIPALGAWIVLQS